MANPTQSLCGGAASGEAAEMRQSRISPPPNCEPEGPQPEWREREEDGMDLDIQERV